MNHKSANQMEQLLKGEPSTLQTKGLIMLAQNQDENFGAVDKRFQNVEGKLDKIIELIKTNKESTDERIELLKIDTKKGCEEHKLKLEGRFKNIETDTESLSYFNKHPKVLKTIAVAILIVIAYLLGNKEIISQYL